MEKVAYKEKALLGDYAVNRQAAGVQDWFNSCSSSGKDVTTRSAPAKRNSLELKLVVIANTIAKIGERK